MRHGLSLSDPLGRVPTKSPEQPRRGPRHDMEFLRARAEMSRRSCAAVARAVYGFIPSTPGPGLPEPDKRPTHDGWPRGVIGGWSL